MGNNTDQLVECSHLASIERIQSIFYNATGFSLFLLYPLQSGEEPFGLAPSREEAVHRWSKLLRRRQTVILPK